MLFKAILVMCLSLDVTPNCTQIYGGVYKSEEACFERLHDMWESAFSEQYRYELWCHQEPMEET